MIVTCERCATQFRLDDAKVPARGVRVRCSRCKHAFSVEPPGGAGRDRVHRAAAEAVSGRSRSTPEVTQDLCVPARRGAGAAEPGLDAEDGTSESEWEFSEDFPGNSGLDEKTREPSQGLAAAREAVDELLGPAPEESRAAVDGPEGPPEEAAGSSDEPSAGVDQLLAEAAQGHSAGELVSNLAPETAPDPLPVDDPLAVDSGESDRAEDASALELRGPARDEELGSPDAWDFFAGAGDLGDGGGAAAVASTRPGSASTQKAGGSESAGAERTASWRVPAPPLELAAEASAGSARLRRVANAVGWTLTAALCLAVLYGALGPSFSEPRAVVDSQRLAGFEAVSVGGRWLENAVAGPIYVVGGDLRRTELGGGPLGAQIEVELLDAAGAALGAAPAAVGPALPVGRLREQDPPSLVEAQELAARQLAWVQLGPGQRLPFHAVFAELPPEAKGFRLRARPVPESLEMADPGPEADFEVSEAGSVDPEVEAAVPGAGSVDPEVEAAVPGAGSVDPEAEAPVPEAGSVGPEADSPVSAPTPTRPETALSLPADGG